MSGDYWREVRKHRRKVRESWWTCLCGRKNAPGESCFDCGAEPPRARRTEQEEGDG